MIINLILGWLLRIVGGFIIIVGWLAYTGSMNEMGGYSLEFMKNSVTYPIVASVIGIIVLVMGTALGRKKD
jgi:hypothetical protein